MGRAQCLHFLPFPFSAVLPSQNQCLSWNSNKKEVMGTSFALQVLFPHPVWDENPQVVDRADKMSCRQRSLTGALRLVSE